MSNQMEPQSEAMPLKLDVSIRHVPSEKNLLAVASLTINDSFAVRGIKVCTGKNGLFVNMPSTPDGKGGYRDTFLPITADARNQLINAVLNSYEKSVEKMQGMVQTASDALHAPEKKPSLLGQVKEAAQKIQASAPKVGAPARTVAGAEL